MNEDFIFNNYVDFNFRIDIIEKLSEDDVIYLESVLKESLLNLDEESSREYLYKLITTGNIGSFWPIIYDIYFSKLYKYDRELKYLCSLLVIEKFVKNCKKDLNNQYIRLFIEYLYKLYIAVSKYYIDDIEQEKLNRCGKTVCLGIFDIIKGIAKGLENHKHIYNRYYDFIYQYMFSDYYDIELEFFINSDRNEFKYKLIWSFIYILLKNKDIFTLYYNLFIRFKDNKNLSFKIVEAILYSCKYEIKDLHVNDLVFNIDDINKNYIDNQMGVELPLLFNNEEENSIGRGRGKSRGRGRGRGQGRGRGLGRGKSSDINEDDVPLVKDKPQSQVQMQSQKSKNKKPTVEIRDDYLDALYNYDLLVEVDGEGDGQ